MKKKLNIKYRLILPIALLGIVALISNVLAVTNIKNVNDNAANIADNYMEGKTQLAKIQQSVMNIHKMALSHIVATDYNTMIIFVNDIKEEEKEEMDSLSLKALIIMPIKVGMNEEYWVCFGVTEKERIWKLDEIRFLCEAVRILQRILIKQSREATPPKRRGTSNTNKRKKK